MLQQTAMADGGPIVSPLIAGTWKWGVWGHKLSIREQADLIRHCVEIGITTFDHADIYGDHTTEEEFGKAFALTGLKRSDVQIVTKCGIKMPSPRRPYPVKSYDTSTEHITWSVDNSLQMLQTDYIDVLLIHRPSPLMDPAEVTGAFQRLQQAGKVRHFGVSNFSPSQFALMNDHFPLVTNQVEASLVHLPPFLDGTFDQAIRTQKRPMIWSPFGSGALFSASPDARIQRIADVGHFLSDKCGAGSVDQIYLAWLLKHPSKPLPILGTARAERIRSAVDAIHLSLGREDWFRLWSASTGEEVP